ncbi:helix-turn-helix domain-containing protein [Pontibacter litorisediminis]|uniref:helix-turn-helix domain-containing protein n=1 Tax=Pontibacter litorisediminis TaxID=1846260 RepID=UPI0023EA9B86|nr:helix-turn-helix transcriptional regulator [Pontibacter litorisediminis]
METAVRKRPIHLGDHVRRMRTALGVKQASLANDLGTTQQNISRIEQEEDMDKATLEKIARALGVTPEAIENFSEEGAVFHINTMNDNSVGMLNQYNFNPIEKIVELYDALLKSEREKNELLAQLLKEKQAG